MVGEGRRRCRKEEHKGEESGWAGGEEVKRREEYRGYGEVR